MKALVYIETKDGVPFKGSLELISCAQSLGYEADAVIPLRDSEDPASMAVIGFDKVSSVKIPDTPTDDMIADIMAKEAKDGGYSLVLMAASTLGKAIVPRAAAKLGAACINDCSKIESEDGVLKISRPAYGGTVFQDIQINTPTAVISVRPGSYAAPEDGEAKTPAEKEIAYDPECIRTAVKEIIREASEDINLEEAKVIVSGGRGMGSEEDFAMLYDLAEAFGGAVGASRPVIESGWISRQHQVGQSGKIVNPDLYIACGISGAVQHLAGMSGSKYIIAINKDEDAPIFDVADLGIVGDVKKIIPILIESAKEFMAGR